MSKAVTSRPLRIIGVISLLATVWSRVTYAQEGISIETFKYSTSTESMYDLVLVEPKQHKKWAVGGLLSHAVEPVYREVRRLEGVERAYPVRYRIAADLYGSLGLFDVAELGLAIPVIIYQDGEGGTPGGEIQHTGLGDPRVDVKGRLLDREPFKLGLAGTLTLPLGHYASSGTDFMGSRYPSFEPKILGEAHAGSMIFALNAGFLLRGRAAVGNTDQTHALTWNAGVAWDVSDFQEPEGFRVALEMNGEVGIEFDPQEIPVETILGFKFRTVDDVILTLGGGPGISRGMGTPMFRVFAGAAYDKVQRNCPAGAEDFDGFEDNDRCIDPDNDRDLILDVEDKCPDEAEDMDSFEDEDGCPDVDNDGDGIPDGVDKCFMIPEDKDDYEDDDGCPEEGPGKPTVEITDTQLLISSKVYFDFNKMTIKEVSYPILDAVAEALAANPHIRKVLIEGHTDNEGTEEYNQQLSEERAKAVLDYLVDRGIPKERLDFRGYGFSRPKASNQSEEGKAINRRVEFTILSGDEP